ncbi:MAG: hypothetical protein HY735_10385 [Verrucomicrobia bacterium]|nr:hypothetical protein [Verrucomicrobiota bacterium]
MKNKVVTALLGVLVTLQTATLAQTEAKWEIKWTDHTANPVDMKSPGSRAYMPYVLYDKSWPAESRYRAWYDTESINGIGYSSSTDGITWSQGKALTGLNADGTSSSGRPVVLYHKVWAKPYRLYYYGNPGGVWQVRVAESADGIKFENDKAALQGGRLGTFPDGHAVAHLPGRTTDPNDPEAARPFIMYFRAATGIAWAESKDGYEFTEAADSPDTADTDEGLIRILPEGTPFNGQPSQVLQLAQNDFRMFVFEQNTNFKYLVSANGLTWEIVEDPVAVIGSTGADGAWNDQRNYSASAAYLGDGRFFLMRGGRANASGLYRTGVAFGESAFYKANDLGKWAYYSPMNNWQAEGWETFTSTGNEPDGTITAIIQNADGTVSVRDRKESGNFYMVHDSAWVVPFTVEFRAKLDDGATTGTGVDPYPKYTVSVFQSDTLNPGPEGWQPAIARDRFGRWNLGDESIAGSIWTQVDNAQFQTYTVVCRFDEAARAQLAINPSDSGASQRMPVFDVYLNRDFSAAKMSFYGTGFAGWPSVDYDGRFDIGFPGPSSGQLTVDWARWGNGVILDPNGPEATAKPVLAIARAANGVRINWTGGGVLQSASELSGPWMDENGVTSGSTVPITVARKFYRVKL